KMKIDPWNHKERYLEWKDIVREGIPDISKENCDIILNYLNDMEMGLNIFSGSVKGPRNFPRLCTLKAKMVFFAKKFKEVYGLDKITDITEEQIIRFFSEMRNGTIKKVNGGIYTSFETQGKAFKAFWHWHQKINKKQGIEISDITADLDSRSEKPDWVYLTEEEVKRLCDEAKYEYKVIMMLIYDTGIRAPTELLNIKVSDFFNDFKELNIRKEVSKTFGRKIKIMLCSDLIKEYVRKMNLESNDYLFNIRPQTANKYLKRLAIKVLGDKVSPAGQKYSQLSMYDFRHNSCCYWLPRYKSESALKYRFGWKKSEEIHYYSEFLGMRDTISEDDMLIDVTKTEIEKQLAKSEREKEIMKEEISSLRMQMKIIEEEFKQIKYSAVQIVEFKS
ncbi:MAG: tyrosine-type recombinase/integrase, partial [Nanoarchaeota archaeon]|nr:tyrosine-type recombinase/integrase [Nanoarchaeota archaeon]